jgi:hypothetical protein
LVKYLKDCKPTYKRDRPAHTFIAALFTIAQVWKSASLPTINEWIKKYVIYIFSGA